MPVHPDRIIDLSYGAAEKLDMISDGLAEVKIEVLKWGDGKYKK
jgi:rare lipoprotein A